MKNPFHEGVPELSANLIAALDEHVWTHDANLEALSTEKGRLHIAHQNGERALVDRLKSALQREQEEARQSDG